MKKILPRSFKNFTLLPLFITPIALTISCGEKEKIDLMVLVDQNDQTKNNSFTQGIIDAMDNQGKEDGFKVNWQQVISNDREGRKKTIENSIANGTNNFVIASFSFSDDLQFLSETFPESKFIAVDTKDKAELPNIANVWAESQEGAFLAGYLTSKEASDRVKKDANFFENDPKSPGDTIKFGYVGGFAFETVTRFYDGIVSGMKFWNEKNKATDYDIDFIYDFSDQNKEDSQTYANDWNYESPSYKAAFQKLINQKVNIVCGSHESVAKYNKDKANAKIWQIANDSDIKDDDPSALPYTFTSILKNIGQGAALIAHELIVDKDETSFKNGKVEGKGINTGVMGVALNNLNKKTYDKIFKDPFNLIVNASTSETEIYNGLKVKEIYKAAKEAGYRQK